ncbi:MAG: HU family DNA-binding protein [Clostridiales bacterium]|nr:HU family DNA-binding protein [Clostridiales bacterium]
MITKSNLVESVAAATGLKKKDSEAAVAETIAAISAALAAGEKVQLTGFGTFEVKERPARTGRNPQNGKAIKIAASKRVAFSAGKNLKDSVNK